MRKLFPAITAFLVIGFLSCSHNANYPTTSMASGEASVSVHIGTIATLGKMRNIELRKLYISLSALGEATIYDTFSLSGTSGTTVSKTYSNLTAMSKQWTLTAESKDTAGVTIHQGVTQFVVPDGSTIPVALNLDAKYSMLKAKFYPIRDSVTRCVLVVGSTTVDDSVFVKQTRLGDTLMLSYNYLETSVSQRINLSVYGTMWGKDTLLYTGDTLISPVPGVGAGYTVSLSWVGPESGTIASGQAGMSVSLGSIGTVTVNGELKKGTVKDIDGNVYTTIQIGNQTWMVENLKTTRYNDGTAIPNVTDSVAWAALTTPGYCWYNNDAAAFKATFGALYNWYSVNTGKLCPSGWHVPTDVDWTTLQTYLISNGFNWDATNSGNKIAKSLAAQLVWTVYSTTGTPGNNLPGNNSSGFSALPGGSRTNLAAFESVGLNAYFWNATDLGSGLPFANNRSIRYNYENLNSVSSTRKNSGFSVRLIKNQTM